MPYLMSSSPIGIFDSGIGGLSVLRAVRALLLGERLIYVGDQVHVLYGSRAPIQGMTFKPRPLRQRKSL